MSKTCTLETHGYQVNFIFLPFRVPGSVYSSVELVLNPELGNVSLKSDEELIFTSDLKHLINYFDNHIQFLKEKKIPESYMFVTDGFNFHLRAYEGVVATDEEGKFPIEILVRIGRDPNIGKPVFIGGWAHVDVRQIKAFQTVLQSVIDEYGD